MKRVILALIGLGALALGVSSALAQEIVGTVVDSNGHAVQGVKVIAQGQGSTVTQSAVTNAQGQYALTSLTAGVYSITLDPGSTNLKGQSVETNLDGRGLTVNWATSPTRDPIALAQPGTTGTSVSSASPLLSTSTQGGNGQGCNQGGNSQGGNGQGCKKSNRN